MKKGKKKLSLCEKKRRRLICCAHYEVNPKQPHRRNHDNCRPSGKFVLIYNHKCYIQRVEKEKTEEQSMIEEQEQSMTEEGADIDEKKKKKPPPLFVIGDIEFLIEEDDEGKNVFISDLIRYLIIEELYKQGMGVEN